MGGVGKTVLALRNWLHVKKFKRLLPFTTDEGVFKVLRERGQGFGILVSKTPKDTHASYSLPELSEVMVFLRQLVKWRKLALRKQCRLRRELEEMKASTRK
nr:probable trehalose-phosphate phosphatase J [Ipomoea batatas]